MPRSNRTRPTRRTRREEAVYLALIGVQAAAEVAAMTCYEQGALHTHLTRHVILPLSALLKALEDAS